MRLPSDKGLANRLCLMERSLRDSPPSVTTLAAPMLRTLLFMSTPRAAVDRGEARGEPTGATNRSFFMHRARARLMTVGVGVGGGGASTGGGGGGGAAIGLVGVGGVAPARATGVACAPSSAA